MMPMRDGVRLFTAVYVPKATAEPYPFLVVRTPYGCGPYGADAFPPVLGPAGKVMGVASQADVTRPLIAKRRDPDLPVPFGGRPPIESLCNRTHEGFEATAETNMLA